jgi:hypothetical protein
MIPDSYHRCWMLETFYMTKIRSSVLYKSLDEYLPDAVRPRGDAIGDAQVLGDQNYTANPSASISDEPKKSQNDVAYQEACRMEPEMLLSLNSPKPIDLLSGRARIAFNPPITISTM